MIINEVEDSNLAIWLCNVCNLVNFTGCNVCFGCDTVSNDFKIVEEKHLEFYDAPVWKYGANRTIEEAKANFVEYIEASGGSEANLKGWKVFKGERGWMYVNVRQHGNRQHGKTFSTLPSVAKHLDLIGGQRSKTESNEP
ncbi:hypothetical protein TL16_g03549 [Triparma laevis f. inornata]|uniref:RanBP2-type domain-containing protein n=1 Tax=Triparma laevis f. inornata TaxID=1714386 RepID=A0A9W6ZYL6_9STRA|nr:hypothetical protein TL16_g03549 [Triparma laevis f. inornata]